jgi:hypothetical protein
MELHHNFWRGVACNSRFAGVASNVVRGRCKQWPSNAALEVNHASAVAPSEERNFGTAGFASALQDAPQLACLAHKYLQICERCRLRQQNNPATPDRLPLFAEKNLKSAGFDSFTLNLLLNRGGSVCLRPF